MNKDSIWEQKYAYYKKKYLLLKNLAGGGPIIETTVREQFSDMEPRISYNTDDNTCNVTIDGCINFIIHCDMIEINSLEKCMYSGNMLLDKVERIATILNKKSIRLIDVSWIHYKNNAADVRSFNFDSCNLDLAYFSILYKGESWYNMKGYISANYMEEKAHNNRLISMPCIEFIKLLKIYQDKSFIDTFSKRKFTFRNKEKNESIDIYKSLLEIARGEYNRSIEEEYIRLFINTFIDIGISINMTVKDVFTMIASSIIRNDMLICSDSKIKFIIDFVNMLKDKNIFEYNNNLVKNII